MTTNDSPPKRARKPKPTPSATFVGGPLDGQTYMKHSRGYWPMYLDNDGATVIPARTGDRLVRIGGPKTCYVHRERAVDGDDKPAHVYEHSTTL
jgi:hypothetical protein